MTEPTTEAYEAAGRAYASTLHGLNLDSDQVLEWAESPAIRAAVDAVWPLAFDAGKRAMIEEIFHPNPDVDLTPPTEQEARVGRINLARRVAPELIAEGRRLAAKAIRASIPSVASDVWSASAPWEREECARIAEGETDHD